VGEAQQGALALPRHPEDALGSEGLFLSVGGVAQEQGSTVCLPLEGFPLPWKLGSSLTMASGPQSSLPPKMFQMPSLFCMGPKGNQ